MEELQKKYSQDRENLENLIGMLDDVVRDMSRKYRDTVESILEGMPSGSSLCVHDAMYGYDNLTGTYSALHGMHIVFSPTECKANVRRTQYGPKPEGL